MSKKWWAVIIVSFFLAAVLTGLGILQFDAADFIENLIIEIIGLLLALGIAVWVIEGKVLTREKRIRDIVRYRQRVFQLVVEIGLQLARDIAEPLASEFDPEIDLYGQEREDWDQFKPLLRKVFSLAKDVRYDGLPPYSCLTKEDADSYMSACREMTERIKERIKEQPDFMELNVLGLLPWTISEIEHLVKRAYRLDLLDEPISRYNTIGELGNRILDMTQCTTPLSEGSELW